ncbi:MAG: hypothetical protein WEE69_08525 [Acidimicrobiia bacterium]
MRAQVLTAFAITLEASEELDQLWALHRQRAEFCRGTPDGGRAMFKLP